MVQRPPARLARDARQRGRVRRRHRAALRARRSRPRCPAPTTARSSTTGASAARRRGGPSSFRTLSPLVDLRGAAHRAAATSSSSRVEAPTPPLLAHRRARPLRRRGVGHREPGPRRRRGARPRAARRAPSASSFTITGLADRWLPAAYEPLATDLEDARDRPESGTLVAPDDDITGLDVPGRLAGRDRRPTRARSTRRARRRSRRACRRRSTLPDDFPESVRRQARADRRAAPTTPYEQAQALAGLLPRRRASPTTSTARSRAAAPTPSRTSSTRGAGFCEQFAGAYAAMARAVGLPTRVAVGLRARRLRRRPDEFSVAGPRRARVARGVARRPGLDAVRAHARRRASRARPTPTVGPAGRARRHDRHDHRRPRPRPSTTPTPAPNANPRAAAASPSVQAGSARPATASGTLDPAVGRPRGRRGARGRRRDRLARRARVARKVRRRTRRRRKRDGPGALGRGRVAGRARTAQRRGAPAVARRSPRTSRRTATPTRGAPPAATEPLADLADLYAPRGLVAARADRRGRRAAPGPTPTRCATRSPRAPPAASGSAER